jgi:Fur family zinc uptake transcriptional regulator
MTKNIVQKAITFCKDNGHRVTNPRIEVLKIISNSKKPIKAYDILNKLSKKIINPKPPTVYRAIEFWEKFNFVHKIDSLNAFTSCEADHLHEGSQFLICDDCGVAIESHLSELPKVLKQISKQKTFKTLRWKLEISGLCNQCS